MDQFKKENISICMCNENMKIRKIDGMIDFEIQTKIA